MHAQVRREARLRAYERALADTMHSEEQAAIQACLELVKQAESMEVGGRAGCLAGPISGLAWCAHRRAGAVAEQWLAGPAGARARCCSPVGTHGLH